MEIIELKKQFSSFADFSSLKVDTKTIGQLFELYKDRDLLPSTIQQLAGPTKVIPRPRLANTDETWSIVILTGRIDVAHSAPNSVGAPPTKEQWQDFTHSAQELAFRFLDGSYTPNRYSLVHEYVIHGLNIQDYINTRFNKIPMYEGQEITEWEWKLASRIDCNEIGAGEQVNVITTLKGGVLERTDSATGVTSEEGILVTLDINTSQDNKAPRLNKDSASVFCNKASELALTISGQLLN